MKRVTKVFLLTLVLIAPVMVVLFLYKFGNNHYDLKVYYPEGLEGVDTNTTGPHVIPQFQLIDQNGKPFNTAMMRGKICIADFIFTNCQGTCPKMSTQMVRVQDAFINQPDVLLISHTVDPENDTVSVLNAYGKKYHADYNKWRFLTGSAEDIYKLAAEGYALVARKEDGTALEAFSHSDKMVLVDTKGQIRGYYDGTSQLKVDTLILETRILIDALKHQGK